MNSNQSLFEHDPIMHSKKESTYLKNIQNIEYWAFGTGSLILVTVLLICLDSLNYLPDLSTKNVIFIWIASNIIITNTVVLYKTYKKSPTNTLPFNDIIIFDDNSLTRRWTIINSEETQKQIYNHKNMMMSYDTNNPIKEIIPFKDINSNNSKYRAINDACLTPIKSKHELKSFLNNIAFEQIQYAENQKIETYERYYNLYKNKNLPLLETPYYQNIVAQGIKLQKEKEAIELAANEKIKNVIDIIDKHNK